MSQVPKELSALHKGLVDSLLKRIEDGTATSTDLNVARQLLKDNDIDFIALMPHDKRGSIHALGELPEFEDDQEPYPKEA